MTGEPPAGLPAGGRVRLDATVRGRVQGVGYRVFALREGMALGLDGSVANLGDELAAGTLTTVLPDFEDASLPVHVIHREGRHRSAKIRSFIDLAVAKLRGDRALQ